MNICKWSGVASNLFAGRIGLGHVRRELQLAGTHLDADQRFADPRSAEPVYLLWG